MEPKCKGNLINQMKEYMTQVHGREKFDSLLKDIEYDHKEIDIDHILESSWVSEKFCMDLCELAYRHFGARFCQEMGSFMCEKGVNKFYKIFINALSPAKIMKTSPYVWKVYHDHGKLIPLDSGENKYIYKLVDLPYPTKGLCNIMKGYNTKFIELSGGKNVRTQEVACAVDGAQCCQFSITWE
ncbi:MAG: hypothetical protein ABII88_06780 [Candidatus Omnitrophota bacterium]